MTEKRSLAGLIGALAIFLCIEAALLFSMAELYAYRQNMDALHLRYRPWFVWLIHFIVLIPTTYAVVTRFRRLFRNGG